MQPAAAAAARDAVFALADDAPACAPLISAARVSAALSAFLFSAPFAAALALCSHCAALMPPPPPPPSPARALYSASAISWRFCSMYFAMARAPPTVFNRTPPMPPWFGAGQLPFFTAAW
jgi:hypothetical protein